MNPRTAKKNIKPFLSVSMIICSLFALVFMQMEERRVGYHLLKIQRAHKQILEEKRQLEIQLAKITRPQLLERVAQTRLTLRKLQADQIIHLSGEGVQKIGKRD